MSNIVIAQDSKLIKVLASQARNERLDSAIVAEANDIISEASTKQLAQTVAYTLTELQKDAVDFMAPIADVKNIGYNEQAAFNVRVGNMKAYHQAKGAQTARSMVTSRQILVPTHEIAVRPAISIIDVKTGRVQMADLVRDANMAMTREKIKDAQDTILDALSGGAYATPFYATSTTTLNKAALDAQIAHFRRYGNVTLAGDMAIVSQLANLAGMSFSSTQTQRSDSMIDEFNNNGFIGKYIGCDVMVWENCFEPNTITPMMQTNVLYIIVSGMSPDQKNLKIVNQGGVDVMEQTNFDDRVHEMLLTQWYGTAFVPTDRPAVGAHELL